MAKIGVSAPEAQSALHNLLGIEPKGRAPAGLAPGLDAPPVQPDVSVAGVMLLTAITVAIAMLGILFLALFLLAGWWVVVHIPLPPFLAHMLARLGLGW